MLASLEYDRFRPAYGRDVTDWVRNGLKDPPVDLTIDVGCGTGRSSRWARAFSRRVIGFDPSREMIEVALGVNDDPAVKFRAGAAENFDTEGRRASLVVVGGAFEWFDQPAFRRQLSAAVTQDGQLAILWSWVETLDETSRAWFRLLRRLLGAQTGPDANDAMAMGRTFYSETPRWTVHRNTVQFDDIALMGFVRSSSYWRPTSGAAANLQREVSEFLAKFGNADGTAPIQFREVVLMGRP